jgi:hypothetical protein
MAAPLPEKPRRQSLPAIPPIRLPQNAPLKDSGPNNCARAGNSAVTVNRVNNSFFIAYLRFDATRRSLFANTLARQRPRVNGGRGFSFSLELLRRRENICWLKREVWF